MENRENKDYGIRIEPTGSYTEIKELVRLCPQLPFLARKVALDQPLLDLIEKAESELAEKEAVKA